MKPQSCAWRRLLLFASILLSLSVAAASAWAQPEEAVPAEPGWLDQLAADYSLRGSWWSSDRELTDQGPVESGTLWLRAQPALSASFSLRLEGWVSDQPALRGDESNSELREAYLAYLGDAVDVRVGRQIVVWGRADRLNPTDNLTSRDYRLLFPEDDDLRRGSAMVQVTVPVQSLVVGAYWIPEFRPNRYPTPALPPYVAFRSDQEPYDPNQWALRLDQSGGAVDWSLSYFQGLDRNPDVAVDTVTASRVLLQRRYHPIRVIGADAASTLGPFGLRAEAAHTSTEDDKGTDPEIKNGFLYAVAGIDRSFLQYLNINVQYLYWQTDRWHDPRRIEDPLVQVLALRSAATYLQLHRIENGMSARIAYQWLHETLTTELSAIQLFQKGDGFIQPKVIYKVTDTLRVTLGAQFYSGPDMSFFGQQKDNETTYLEIRWGY